MAPAHHKYLHDQNFLLSTMWWPAGTWHMQADGEDKMQLYWIRVYELSAVSKTLSEAKGLSADQSTRSAILF